MKQIVVAVAVLVSALGCASARITSSAARPYVGPRISAIAISPGGGVLGEAVGVELFNFGYRVLDPGQTAQIVARVNMTELEIGQPKSFEVLPAAGADALLIVNGTLSTEHCSKVVNAGLQWMAQPRQGTDARAECGGRIRQADAVRKMRAQGSR